MRDFRTDSWLLPVLPVAKPCCSLLLTWEGMALSPGKTRCSLCYQNVRMSKVARTVSGVSQPRRGTAAVSTRNLPRQFCCLFVCRPVQGQENRIAFSNYAFENCSKTDTFLIQNVFTAFGSLMEQGKQIKIERPYIFFDSFFVLFCYELARLSSSV